MAIDKKHWQNAMSVQDACNLSGVVFSFEKAMQAICDEANAEGHGTDWKNTHPIVVLFTTQLAYLSNTATVVDSEVYRKAYEAVEAMIKE
jgi:hypothetical protein